jgi:hypothetical protein
MKVERLQLQTRGQTSYGPHVFRDAATSLADFWRSNHVPVHIS